MNGSKNLLLVAILFLALAPWGLVVWLVNSERGLEILGADAPDETSIRQEEGERHGSLIATLESEINRLKEEAAQQASEPDEEFLAQVTTLENELSDEKEEKNELRSRVTRLQTQYDAALSEVVRLKTESMAAQAAPKPIPAAEEAPEEEKPSRPDSSGGWILPPSN